MTDIVEQLKEKAGRAQTPKSRDFYLLVKAEIERLRAENVKISVHCATLIEELLKLGIDHKELAELAVPIG
jgi:hypothetical protein